MSSMTVQTPENTRYTDSHSKPAIGAFSAVQNGVLRCVDTAPESLFFEGLPQGSIGGVPPDVILNGIDGVPTDSLQYPTTAIPL